MACKLKGKASNICRFRDALSPQLDEIAEADGLVLGSPIYFGEIAEADGLVLGSPSILAR